MIEDVRIENDGRLWRIHYSPSGYVFTTSDPVQVRKAVELILMGDDTKPVRKGSEIVRKQQEPTGNDVEGYDEWSDRIADSDETETTRYPVGLRSAEGKRVLVLERRNAKLEGWIAELESRLDRIEHLLESIAGNGDSDEV